MSNGEQDATVPRGTSDASEAPSDFIGLVERMRARFVEVTCPVCKATFPTRVDAPRDRCEKCEAANGLTAQAAHVIASIERWMPRWLATAGLSVREASAAIERIPDPLLAKLKSPRRGLDRLISGGLPEAGFGISGPAGCGKSFALAALFKANARARWVARAASEGTKATKLYLSWLRWPEVVNDMRVRSTRDGGLNEVDSLMRKWATVEALVIDDIGGERVRGEYGEDWMASQLDILIDRRYNDMMPTWYTTNLAPPDLLDRYGARFFSRLTGGSPLIVYDAKADLRLVKEGT